ncbi:rab geranylgeranyltransferase subunit alpha [Oratosquilla oratoria]|uniref:rab geranylgeranyltransferase subunit alpha n=1 Tax=Oratosquilla oratoria TaxID=337810 RepID=UPI003F76F092
MHGRLKVKTTEEQAAEKAKEREEKRKQYLGGLNLVLDKRSKGVYDEEGLNVLAQLLMVNPDALTLWNFRREILVILKGDSEGTWQTLLIRELKMIENCLLKNPKSYGAWHHRSWILDVIPEPPWEEELDICSKYLKMDERNFHCWDHRRFVVNGSEKKPEEELKFSKKLIERNLSNYSAWHYRSKLLPLVFPPDQGSLYPIAEDMLVKELETVVEAVFTDPSDQSPWFFLRWLLNQNVKLPYLHSACYIQKGECLGTLVCVFTKEVNARCEPVLLTAGESVLQLNWSSPTDQEHSCVWVADFPMEKDTHYDLALCWEGRRIELAVKDGIIFVCGKPDSSLLCPDQSENMKKTLSDTMNNCITLMELEPGNKWVLLTLVEVMAALDTRLHKDAILKNLAELADIDPQRSNYYFDMSSKLIMDAALCEYESGEYVPEEFALAGKSLTLVPFSHRLACTKIVDLSNNKLTSLAPLRNIVSCTKLNIQKNNIKSLKGLSDLKYLEELYLDDNNMENISEVGCLSSLKYLHTLSLTNNPLCKSNDVGQKIRELLPRLKTLNL